GLLIAFFAVHASNQVFQSWRRNNASAWTLVPSTVLALASLSFALSLGGWLPLAWRTSELNLTALAAKYRQAGTFVEPTLCIYQNLDRMRLGRSAELLSDPVNRYLPPDIRSRWGGIPANRSPFKERAIGFLFRRTLSLCQRVTHRLQDAGVPLMLG